MELVPCAVQWLCEAMGFHIWGFFKNGEMQHLSERAAVNFFETDG